MEGKTHLVKNLFHSTEDRIKSLETANHKTNTVTPIISPVVNDLENNIEHLTTESGLLTSLGVSA